MDVSTLRTVKQNLFIKDEFRYLDVPRVGALRFHDVFDCTFECLSNPWCFSVNLAASKGADGKLWCELLSSDKYRNSAEYNSNKSSHHFFVKVRNIASEMLKQFFYSCQLSFRCLVIRIFLYLFYRTQQPPKETNILFVLIR